MPGGLTRPPVSALEAEAHAALDRRLRRDTPAPIALGLSGGGDSLALLHIAAAWARAAGRPLLALTVDHGLSPHSAAWTRRAGEMAATAGAAWRALLWEEPKPSTGLTAAARTTRHRLLAEAARDAGARVVLLAHTADDAAEGDRMRATGEAPTLGALREWAPSPVWPEGRGLFLLRPLLHASRSGLRSRLDAEGLAWIDDPANTDLRFARARARAALATGLSASAPRPRDPRAAAFTEAVSGCGGGSLAFARDALEALADPVPVLGAALLCVAGGERPPESRAVRRAIDRLASDDATLTLAGARVSSHGGAVRIARERGRRAAGAEPLTPDMAMVWDGRFEVAASAPGWTIRPLCGLATQLAPAERAALRPLTPCVRTAFPAFVSPGGEVRLAPPFGVAPATARPLARDRLLATLGAIAREP